MYVVNEVLNWGLDTLKMNDTWMWSSKLQQQTIQVSFTYRRRQRSQIFRSQVLIAWREHLEKLRILRNASTGALHWTTTNTCHSCSSLMSQKMTANTVHCTDSRSILAAGSSYSRPGAWLTSGQLVRSGDVPSVTSRASVAPTPRPRCRQRGPTSVDADVRRRRRRAFDTRPQIAVLLPRPFDALLSLPWPADLQPISIPEQFSGDYDFWRLLKASRFVLSRVYILYEVLNRAQQIWSVHLHILHR